MSILILRRVLAFTVLLCLTVAAQAQNLDARWRLRVEDLTHHVRAEATIQFTNQAAESCMGGKWKRLIVNVKSGNNSEFFPISEPLAYQLEGTALTLGRAQVCDGYSFLSGKLGSKKIHGIYEAVSIGYVKKLGSFSLERIH